MWPAPPRISRRAYSPARQNTSTVITTRNGSQLASARQSTPHSGFESPRYSSRATSAP